MRILAPFAAILLSACMAGAEQPATDMGYVEISAGTYRHNTTVRVYRNDQIVIERLRPGQGETSETIAGDPGLFVQVAAYVAAEGPVAMATARNAPPCPDYGGQSVRAVPPIGGFTEVSAACPDPAVSGLRQALEEIIGIED